MRCNGFSNLLIAVTPKNTYRFEKELVFKEDLNTPIYCFSMFFGIFYRLYTAIQLLRYEKQYYYLFLNFFCLWGVQFLNIYDLYLILPDSITRMSWIRIITDKLLCVFSYNHV